MLNCMLAAGAMVWTTNLPLTPSFIFLLRVLIVHINEDLCDIFYMDVVHTAHSQPLFSHSVPHFSISTKHYSSQHFFFCFCIWNMKYLSLSYFINMMSQSVSIVLQITVFLLHCWIIFHYVHTLHFLYPFFCWWAPRLIPYVSYCSELLGRE